MSWKKKVYVSEQTYRSSFWIMYFFRSIGLFPIKFHREKSGRLYMQWSPIYAIYSYLLATFLQCTALTGALMDQAVDPERSIRVRSRTDVFVNVIDICATETATFFALFVIPSTFPSFFAYVSCINQIDAALKTTHPKLETLKQSCKCFGWALAVAIVLANDCLMYLVTVGDRLGNVYILKMYFTYYVTCFILLVAEYQYQYMGDSIIKRIKRLNRLLETFYWLDQKKKAWGKVGPVGRRVVNVDGTKKGWHQDANQRIDVLLQAYLDLTTAVNHQNRLLGKSGVALLMTAFFHLLTASYFLFTELFKRQDPVALTNKVMLGFFHAIRILMMIEPWYACCVEVELTKKWVCKLRCTEVGRTLKRKLRVFQLVLGLQSVEFSLAGFVVINRSLVATILGSITTYLAILLQYQAEDETSA